MAWALPSNVTTIGDYGQYVVSVDPNFFNLLLLALFLIIFIALRASPNLSTPIALTTSAFGGTLASVILLIGGLVGLGTTLMFVIALVCGVILLIREGGQG